MSTDKEEFRKLLLKQRRQLPEWKYLSDSRTVCRKLLASEVYQQAETILCYAACRHEVETAFIMEQALKEGKIVALPRVKGPLEMLFLKIRSLNDLKPGFCGIAEPDEGCFEEVTSGLMFVPGIAFDRQLHRIGYGGGYYDAWLGKYGASVYTCGLAYDFQLLPSIPFEAHDQPVNMLVTPKTILRERDV